MRLFKTLWIAVLVCLGVQAQTGHAQSTSGVFGPVVRDGQTSAQLRLGYDPDDDDYAVRLHYQRVISDALRWRVIGQVRNTSDSDADLDYVQAEMLWQVTPDGQDWQTGFRFDARIRDGDDRPDRVAVNWTNDFKLSDQYSARAILIGDVEVGDNADDGVGLQARARLNRRLPNSQSVGVEWFSSLGSTEEFESLEDQRHQLGPYYNRPLGENWSLYTSVLLGVTDPATDVDIRVWINRRL